MTFGAALGAFGSTAPQGFQNGYNFYENARDKSLGHDAGSGYGALLRAIAMQNGVPQMPAGPPQAPQGPMAPQGPGGNVVPFPQPKPPPSMPQMGMGGGQPQGMPQGGPQQGPPNAPPMPQGMPQQGGPPPQGQGPQQGGNPFQNLTLSQIVNGIKQTNPSISDEALGMAVDKFLPMMNVQAQMQYHQLMLGNQSRRTDIAQQNADQRGDYMRRRGDQFDAAGKRQDERIRIAEQNSFKRMPDSVKQQADSLRVRYQQESQNYRSAKYQASMDPSNEQAQQDVTTAQALMFDSQRSYLEFLESNGGASPANAAPNATPAPATQPKPIGQGPNGQPLYPVTPAKPAKTSALPNGQGGPLQGTVASSGIVGPTRARPADADVWDNAPSPQHPRNGPFPNAAPGSIPDNTAPITKPDAPAMFASRGPGDSEAPVEDQSPAGIAQSASGDYSQIQQTIAQLKDAHAKLAQTMAQTPSFRQDQAQPTRANAEATAAESSAMPDGHMQFRLENIQRHIDELGRMLDGFGQNPDELTRKQPDNDFAAGLTTDQQGRLKRRPVPAKQIKGRTVPYGAARAS